MSVLLMSLRVQMLPQEVISSASNTFAKKSKRLGVLGLPLGRLEMVVFIYSNILLSVSVINIADLRVRRVSWQPRTATWTVGSTCTKPPKRRGTIWPREKRTRKNIPSVYKTSSTTTVNYHQGGRTKMDTCAHHNSHHHHQYHHHHHHHHHQLY